jgi:protein-tyrosine phosphatase
MSGPTGRTTTRRASRPSRPKSARKVRRRGIPLDVRTGAEVDMERAAQLDDDELTALHLGDGPWLLLECPLAGRATGFEDVARDLLARGHRVLLAHPERSPYFRRDPGALARLVGDGMLAQVTATSFTGLFGREVQAQARRMLEDGLVADVASDAHSATGSRPPVIGPVLERAGLDAALIEHVAQRAPAAIAAGEPVPAAPPAAGLRRA